MLKPTLLRLILAAGALPLAAATAQAASQPVYEQQLTPHDIHAVQERLATLGFYKGAIDDSWGSDTQAALKQFQQNRGLQPTGALNPATVDSLGLDRAAFLSGDSESASAAASGSASAPPSASVASASQPAQGAIAPTPPPPPLTPAIVREMQVKLYEQGFYHGRPDAVWGRRSQEALVRFQRAHGLQDSGRLTSDTLVAMGLDPNNPVAEGSSSPPR